MSNQSCQGDQMAGAAGAQPSVETIIARETAAVQELHGRDGLHTVHGKLRRGTLAAVAGGGYTFTLIDQKGTVVNNLTEQQARAAVQALDQMMCTHSDAVCPRATHPHPASSPVS